MAHARFGYRAMALSPSRRVPIPNRWRRLCATVDAHVPLLVPEQDEAILREAGFSDVGMFYAGFTWRGWVGYA